MKDKTVWDVDRASAKRLMDQAELDVKAMRPYVDDPRSPFTRGIIDRHREMADLLRRYLVESGDRD